MTAPLMAIAYNHAIVVKLYLGPLDGYDPAIVVELYLGPLDGYDPAIVVELYLGPLDGYDPAVVVELDGHLFPEGESYTAAPLAIVSEDHKYFVNLCLKRPS